jgi:acetolactate synthase I/II/III large subunit
MLAPTLAPVRTGGELVLDSLKAAGIDVAFGVISVHNIPIVDAIGREGGVRLVTARGEHGAASMADGYARATGRLAAVLTSTAGGAANAAAPLLEAFSASSPVLHVTGQVEAAYVDQQRGSLHEAKDQLGMLERVGKAAFRASRTEDIPELLRQAIQLAQRGRPGPVSVEIPIDQQYRSIAAQRVDPIPAPMPSPPDTEALAQAADLLRNAQRPLLWAGGGAISANASEALTALAERIGAGVLTTASGRGSISEDHAQCIGFFINDPDVAQLLSESDLLLALGTRFRGMDTRSWQIPLPSKRVQVDADPSMLGRNYPVDVAIVGDARLALESLIQQVGASPKQEWLERVQSARSSARARVRATLGPYERVLDDLRSRLPRDAIVVRDVTTPASTWGSRLLETYTPRTTIHSATVAIGLGLGLAVGASVGCPKREVVLLVGDGGFALALSELITAAEHGTRLRAVVFNDGGYGILRRVQDMRFEGRHFGVDLKTPDYLQLAGSMGVWAAQVRSPSEMGPQLAEALQQPGPALIEVDMQAIG